MILTFHLLKGTFAHELRFFFIIFLIIFISGIELIPVFLTNLSSLDFSHTAFIFSGRMYSKKRLRVRRLRYRYHLSFSLWLSTDNLTTLSFHFFFHKMQIIFIRLWWGFSVIMYVNHHILNVSYYVLNLILSSTVLFLFWGGGQKSSLLCIRLLGTVDPS